jgi:hypothetical protein
VGFPAPRLVEVTDDYEELNWIEGESGVAAWAKVVDEGGLRQWARFLRSYHDAVRASSTWVTRHPLTVEGASGCSARRMGRPCQPTSPPSSPSDNFATASSLLILLNGGLSPR